MTSVGPIMRWTGRLLTRTPRIGWRDVAGRLQALELDVLTFLTVWLGLLYLLSARQIFGPLGAVGSPAMIAGMGAALAWCCAWFLPQTGLRHEPHPMRPAPLAWAWYGIISFAIAMQRPVTELELTGADRGLIKTAAMVGIAMLAADGIRDLDGVTRLMRRLMLFGGAMAVIGIGEFLYGTRLEVLLPGLTWDKPAAVASRSGFNRPRATGLHPIEFSVVMGALLPVAIHFALYDLTRARRQVAGAMVVVIGVAIPMSVSRSGVVSLAVGMLILAVGWKVQRLVNAAALVAAGAVTLWWLLPRLMDTVVSLFTQAGSSHSVQARIDRLPQIMELVRERPWFGLGNGTWSPEDYFLIDNEVWVTTLQTGIVGLLLLGTLLVLGIVVSLCIRSFPGVDAATGHLGRAVAASIAALSVSLLTFDAFHYRILMGTLFLLLGTAGALWRLTADRSTAPPSPPGPRAHGPTEAPSGGRADRRPLEVPSTTNGAGWSPTCVR
jgi:polysaccharide biosynthesis protein PslJ